MLSIVTVDPILASMTKVREFRNTGIDRKFSWNLIKKVLRITEPPRNTNIKGVILLHYFSLSVGSSQ